MKSIKSNGCVPSVLDKQAMTREIESIVDSPEILKGTFRNQGRRYGNSLNIEAIDPDSCSVNSQKFESIPLSPSTSHRLPWDIKASKTINRPNNAKAKRRKYILLKKSKLKAFSILFMFLAFLVLSFQIVIGDFSTFTILHLIGSSGFILLGITSFVASKYNEQYILVVFLIASLINILYSVIWIAGVQVIFAIAKNDRFHAFGGVFQQGILKGSDGSHVLFIILLSAHYLIIGVGTALSIMTVAFASSALKELSLQSTAEQLSLTGMGMITIVRSI